MNWSEEFKRSREALKLSIQDMAYMLNTTRQTIWRIEAGTRQPSHEMIDKFLNVTGQQIKIIKNK